jgi:ligand-binding sensor domain-containing protein
MKKDILIYALLLIHFPVRIISAQNPKWINYTCGKYVTSIAIEGNTVWAGTVGGLVQLDMNSENIIYYNKANSGLPSNRIRSIAIDGSGNKWIGTRNGLAKFDGINWTVYNTSNSGLHENSVLSIAIDGSGNKWIGIEKNGLAKFDDTNWTVYSTVYSKGRTESFGAMPNNPGLSIDRYGNIYLATFYCKSLEIFNRNVEFIMQLDLDKEETRPIDVAEGNNQIYIVDNLNDRIIVYKEN